MIGLASIVVCWKWGNWRNWKEYYPTILYFLVGNLVYIVITQYKPLWNFGEIFRQFPILDIIFMLSIYPSTTILFLSFYPFSTSPKKQALYIVFWVALFTLLEYIAYLTGGFGYTNGWNIGYSTLFNFLMFPLLRLHIKKPLLVWPVSALLAFLLLFWFRIPLAQ